MSPSSFVARSNAALMLSCERRSSAMATALRFLISGSASVSLSASALEFGQREVVALARQRHGDGAAEACRRAGYQARVEADPCSVLHAAIARLGELHVADAGGEIRLHRRAGHDMAQEILPADAIGVLERPDVRHLVPVGAIVHVQIGGDGEMRGARRLRVGRGPAPVQAGDGRALGAVDLEREQVVAPHPRRPGRQDGADRAVFQLDQGRGIVLDVDVVARAALVDPLRRRRRHRGDDAPHRPERVLDHVAPVRIHVEDEPAAVLLAVVPARPLARPPRCRRTPTSRTRCGSRSRGRRNPTPRAATASAVRAGRACPRPRRA